MPMNLSTFRVEALHGKRTINLEFRDNKLVLIGENGSGKSTIVNLLYYFLSCQWRRIRNYEFKSITAIINDKSISITKDMMAINRDDIRERHDFPAPYRRIIEQILADKGYAALEDIFKSERQLAQISSEYEINPTILSDLVRHVWIDMGRTTQLTMGVQFRHQLSEAAELIKSQVNAQILYLPTYRRIEQELKSIFPNFNIEELDKFRQRELAHLKKRAGGFVELVEFGMKDVEDMVEKTMARLRDYIRIGLNVLTASYLKDIINGAHRNLDLAVLRGLDESKLVTFINNIDERTLASFEKRRLQEIVQKIRRDETLNVDEKVISHFLFKLAELRQKQEQNELKVRSFVDLTNKYLIGKRIVYNDQEFQLSIRPLDEDGSGEQVSSEPAVSPSDQIKMSMLSSGEKQIVSLFAHVYFSEEKEYFVVVDEPELSLSVPWQKRFLPDIMSTKLCAGLIAVTHSPFIYDNEFDTYAQPLSRFVEVADVIRR